MSYSYSNSRELLDFINNNSIALSDFLFGGNSIALPLVAMDLSEDELKHEKCHATIWSQIGVDSTFHRDSSGFPFTAPNTIQLKAYIEANELTKEQFLAFYSTVVTAPKDLKNLSLDGSDLRTYKIISREIKTREELALYVAGLATTR